MTTRMSVFQNRSSRRLPGRSLGAKTGEEAPYSEKSVKVEPRYLGCYGVLKEPRIPMF